MKSLKEIKGELEYLRHTRHIEEIEENYDKLELLIRRFIDRIYPEKQAKELKSYLDAGFYLAGRSEEEKHKAYLDDIDRAINLVETILKEHETAGFDEFKPLKEKKERMPLKEKTETTWQIGSEKVLGFFRKKKTK